jgi:hypothetical protein
MRNLKKVLALLVVFTMVLSTVAFAASPTSVSAGIEDKAVKAAVERLVAFGIVAGKEDGSYHPEENLTREQFAKLVVEALGLGAAANAANGATQFVDVEPNRWSAGYISVAAGQGIVKGISEDKFGPEEPVTYPQAVTMLVRALGYKDEFLKGVWPSNYVAKAAELDITDDVKYSVSGVVDRGSAAVLVDNTLDAKIIKQSTYGDDNNWVEQSVTLLQEKLKIEKYDDERITKVPKVDKILKSNEITIEGDKDGTFEVVQEGVSVNSLFGLQATVYMNDDDEIVYVEADDSERVVKDRISDVTVNSGDVTNFELKVTDDDFDLNDDVVIYVNNTRTDLDDAVLTAADTNRLYGKFILNDDDEIVFADLYKWDEESILVSEVNTEKGYFRGYKKNATSDTKIDISDEDGYKIFINGEEAELKDLKANDVVDLVKVDDADDTVYYVFATRNVVEGKLERVKYDDATIDIAKVDGKEYDINKPFATYSLDTNDDVKDYTQADDIEDAIGEQVQLILDKDGEVRHIITDVEATSDYIYGVVTKVYTGGEGDSKFKVLTKNDEEVSYVYDDGDFTVTANTLIRFTINSDGEADDIVVVALWNDANNNGVFDADETAPNTVVAGEELDDISVGTAVTDFNDDYDTITIAGTTYYVTDKTALFSLLDGTDVDASVVDWADIKDKTVNATALAIIDEDNPNELGAIVFIENFDAASDSKVGAVLDKFYDGDHKVSVDLWDGETEDFVYNTGSSSIYEGDFVIFDTDSDDEIISVTRAVYDDSYYVGADINVGGDSFNVAADDQLDDFKNDLITIGSNTYKVTADTEVYVLTLDDGVYDEVKKGDKGDISKDSKVRVIYEKDGNVRVARIVVVVE